MIKLWTSLRQVEIVAKMVDVDHEATRELGVNWQAR
jgi:type II secretory pathway component GspD/PulD (secretin)